MELAHKRVQLLALLLALFKLQILHPHSQMYIKSSPFGKFTDSPIIKTRNN
jgi:hypothetical protein